MKKEVSFKKRFKIWVGLLFLCFVVLFLFRLASGYQGAGSDHVFPLDPDRSETLLVVKRNYASEKYKVAVGQSPIRVDQKYEKIADINSFSTQFDAEELQIRNSILEQDGLVQYEDKTGNEGYRRLHLVIGVPPENFDVLYENLITIGKVRAKRITKKDKTNEYMDLNAKKASLEKVRQSLMELKSKSGEIADYMQLENRILEIEQQLQELGVSLGNFDAENEFCTVMLSLSEGRQVEIGLLQRIKAALEWTITIYLKWMAVLGLMGLFVYLSLASMEKIRTKL